MKTITVSTPSREVLVDITSEVKEAVRTSGVSDGICLVYVPHTTAGVTINENADPAVKSDIAGFLARLIPRSADFEHVEGNSDSHIKSSLVGASEIIPIEDSRLMLGTWQGICFVEFDGPRKRSVTIKIIGA